jgi:hypothetical protein
MKLSQAQKNAFDAIIHKYLKTKDGYYYYGVQSQLRRNCRMRVSEKTIQALLDKNLITPDQLPKL